ncbi:MAG: PDZ domain-containing protein [Clostridia bacterium]|nr:PDZ domain-containing protein [Clostridia bacterium]
MLLQKARKRILIIGLVAVAAAVLCLIFVHPHLFPANETPAATAEPSAAALGLVVQDTDNGLYVLAVREGSAADLAGVRSGDYLLSVDGDTVATADELESLLPEQGKEQLTFALLRYGAEVTITVTLP